MLINMLGLKGLSNTESMAGYSVARCVNYCKCMENYQIFRRIKSFGGR